MSASKDRKDEHSLASADSLPGQLQRGRGLGFLRALHEGATVIEPLLFDCIIHDPRWDRQLESRSAYYAALLQQLALPLDAFDVYLRACAEDDAEASGDAEYTVLDTICALAVRGDVAAIAIVRAYLTYGHDWVYAFETLMEVSSALLSVDEVSRIIDQRSPDHDTLDDALFNVGPGTHTQQEPWRSLRRVNPRVDHILSTREQETEQRQHEQELLLARFARLSLSELFTLDITGHMAYRVARILQQHVSSTDLDMLLDKAQDGKHWQRYLAFCGLQRLAHPAALPILQAFFESPAAQPGSLYGAAIRAIIALPSSATLELARDWFATPDGPYRHCAFQIIKTHTMATDAGRVYAALLPSLARDRWGTSECYMQCDMLKFLARFPEARFYTTVETIFEEAKYARTRIYAAQVLVACDQEQFAHGRALECLWDSEERVRLIGCRNVELPGSEASPMLQAMAYDPHEDAEVRHAAKERLSAGKLHHNTRSKGELEED